MKRVPFRGNRNLITQANGRHPGSAGWKVRGYTDPVRACPHPGAPSRAPARPTGEASLARSLRSRGLGVRPPARAGAGPAWGARARGRGQGGGAAELSGWAWRTAAAEVTSGSGSGAENPCGTRATGRGERRGNSGRKRRVGSGRGPAGPRGRIAEAARPGRRRRSPRGGGGALVSPEVVPFVCLPRPLRPLPFPQLRPIPLPLSWKPPPGPSGARAPALVLFGLGRWGSSSLIEGPASQRACASVLPPAPIG